MSPWGVPRGWGAGDDIPILMARRARPPEHTDTTPRWTPPPLTRPSQPLPPLPLFRHNNVLRFMAMAICLCLGGIRELSIRSSWPTTSSSACRRRSALVGCQPASAALLPVAPPPGQAPCGRGPRRCVRPSFPTERVCNRVLREGDGLTQTSLRDI